MLSCCNFKSSTWCTTWTQKVALWETCIWSEFQMGQFCRLLCDMVWAVWAPEWIRIETAM